MTALNPVQIILKKRDGGEMTREEIQAWVRGIVEETIPDYQLAAWLMAVYFQGMSDREAADLTLAMARSGEVVDLSDTVPLAVDKHSSGGVGDKTTLVLGPMVAATGLPFAKMSGRALGFTGGTLDKLESIPGFRVDLTVERFKEAVREVGLVVAGQTGDLAPADKRLYALRDVTGTIESIPLIAASIMSKKIAAGARAIVLDVKTGHGAFLSNPEDAKALARLMVAIGRQVGRQVAAVVSSMEQPLGRAVGNAPEVREAIETLQGRGPEDLVELCLTLGSQLLVMAGAAADEAEARSRLREALDSGAAWAKFKAMVAFQGGDVAAVEDPDRLPRAPVIEPLPSPADGVVQGIAARDLGYAVAELGAGRKRKGDPVDPRVGLVLHRKVGERIAAGEPLVTVHAPSREVLERVRERILGAFRIGPGPAEPPPLILEVLR